MNFDNELLPSNESQKMNTDEFDSLLESYLPKKKHVPSGEIVKVPIVAIHSEDVMVDIGGKSEGLIDIEEFKDSKGNITVKQGDKVDVIIGGWDDETGQRIISHKKALELIAIDKVERSLSDGVPIKGKVIQEVKGGLIVDIGIPAFLPASQIDLYKRVELSSMIGKEIDALVLEFDKQQRRTILSRRRLLEEIREKRKNEFFKSLPIGSIKNVKVKRIFDFGAFCELGEGLDGFIPREEVSYDKGSHPSQFLKENSEITVKIISIDEKNDKVTLSRKQAMSDPWLKMDEKYPVGKTIKGQVVSITSFGAFVYLEEGITGMIHISDMSWDRKSKKPSDYVKEGDFVQVIVLEYDKNKRRLALGMKQTLPDPWNNIEERFPVGSVIKGEVTSIANFGAFVKLSDGVEGLIHISDFSWEKRVTSPSQFLKVGADVEAVVLKIEKENRRISLGLKQLSENPIQLFIHSHAEGDIVKGKVKNAASFGIFVELAPGVEGLIPISHISLTRVENPETVYKQGDEVEVKIIKLDADNEKISLSVKEHLKDLERKEIDNFINKDASSGTNIGDLLSELEFELDDSFLDESAAHHKEHLQLTGKQKTDIDESKKDLSQEILQKTETPKIDNLFEKKEESIYSKPFEDTKPSESTVSPPSFLKSGTGIYSSLLSSLKESQSNLSKKEPAEPPSESHKSDEIVEEDKQKENDSTINLSDTDPQN